MYQFFVEDAQIGKEFITIDRIGCQSYKKCPSDEAGGKDRCQQPAGKRLLL